MYISICYATYLSLPSRKCGLKSFVHRKGKSHIIVTSFAEVWIEIFTLIRHKAVFIVTSFAEVWIEIISFH